MGLETGGYSRPPWQGYQQAKPYLPQELSLPNGSTGVNAPALQQTGFTAAVSIGTVLLTLEALLQIASQQEALGAQRLQPFLKDLLNAPKGWQQFLAQMSQHPELNALKEPLLPELLKEFNTLHIPLDVLQQALEQQLGQASSQLLRLVQGSALAQVGGNNPVLSELLTTLGQWQQQAHSSPVEALGLYMQLYLQSPNMPAINPALIAWHFLPPLKQEELSGDKGSKGNAEAEATGEATLVVLLETATLGRLRLQLMQPEATSLLVIIEHEAMLEKTVPATVEERFVEQQRLSAPSRLELSWRPFKNSTSSSGNETDASKKTTPPEALNQTSKAKEADKPPVLQSSSPSDAGFTASADPKLAFYPQQGVSLPVLTAGMLLVKLLVNIDQTRSLRQAFQPSV